MSRERYFKLLITTVFLIGFLVRTINIHIFPDGFRGDEAGFGYNAYAILKEGTDEYGKKFPLYFESIGDYKYPVYVYLLVPFIAVFGLNEFSTRLFSAVTGSLSVIILFLAVNKLTGKRLLATVVAGSLAFSPWHIIFSRSAMEVVVGLFFVLLTIYFYISYLNDKTIKNTAIIIISFLLAVFSYSAYRLFLPLYLLFITPIINYPCSKISIKRSVLLIPLFLLVGLVSLSPESRARAGNLFGQGVEVLNVGQAELILEDGVAHPGSTFWTRMYHNKFLTAAINYLSHYLNHFNPEYLFINGDKTRQMYNIPNTGLLYLFEIPLILIGFIFLYTNHKKFFLITLGWIIIGVIPSSLVNEPPGSFRLLVASPAFMVLTGSGLYALARFIYNTRNRGAAILGGGMIVSVIFFNVGYVYHQYVIHSVRYRPWDRDVGMKEVVEEVNKIQSGYKYVAIPDDQYIYFLFYDKILPSEFIESAKMSEGGAGRWNRVSSFGKINFKMEYQCPKRGRVDTLYICKGPNVPQNSRILHVIRFKDNSPAYTFIDFFPLKQMSKNRPLLPPGISYMIDIDQTEGGIIPESENRLW